jgi:hypothetical protein
MEHLEKLRVLLPHWLEHNHSHIHECQHWADQTRAAGEKAVADALDAVTHSMEIVNADLKKALLAAGGNDSPHERHHHHHHDHDHHHS